MRQHESVQVRTCLVHRLKLLQIVEVYLSSYSTQHILQLFNAPWFGESRDKWWSLLWHELHEGRLLNWLLFYIHNFLPTYSHPQHDLKDRCGPPSKDAKTYITQTHKGKVHRRLDPFPSQNSFFKKGKVWLICLATFWPHALFLSCIEEERHVIYIVHGGVGYIYSEPSLLPFITEDKWFVSFLHGGWTIRTNQTIVAHYSSSRIPYRHGIHPQERLSIRHFPLHSFLF